MNKIGESSSGLYLLARMKLSVFIKIGDRGLMNISNGDAYRHYMRDYQGSFQLRCRFISRLIYVNGRSCLIIMCLIRAIEL